MTEKDAATTTAATETPGPVGPSYSNSAGSLPAEDADLAAVPAPAPPPWPQESPESPESPEAGPATAVPVEPMAVTRVPVEPVPAGPAPVASANVAPDPLPTATPQAASPPHLAAAPAGRPRRPLFGTILWGVILLTFAAYMLVSTLLPRPVEPTLWLLGGVIAVGVLLVVAGIAASLRRAG